MCSHAWLFFATLVTPWTVAPQVPLSMRFSRQEYWRGLPFPSSGDLPNPRIKSATLMSPALAGRFSTAEPPGTQHRTVLTPKCLESDVMGRLWMYYVDLSALRTHHYYFKYLYNMKTIWASLVTEKVKNLLATQETGLIPGEGNGYPLQYSCLENSRQGSLVGYSPWCCRKSDTTKWLIHMSSFLDFLHVVHK